MRAEADGGLTVCAARRGYEASFCCGQFARELRCPSCNGLRTALPAVHQPHGSFLSARVCVTAVRCRWSPLCLPPSLSGFRSWVSRTRFSAAVFQPLLVAASLAVFVGCFRRPLPLAAFIGRFHWPLSLATSLSRSLPARRPRQCGGIPFAYLLATPPCGDNTFAEERKEHGTCIHRQQRSAGKAGPPAWAAFPQNQRGR